MSDSIWLIAAFLSALLGMVWLAMSLKSHWQQVFPDLSFAPHSARLRTAGSAFLSLSIVCCFIADHPTMAVLVWIMLLPLSAGLVAMTLSAYPKLLQALCPKFFVSH